MLSPAQVSCFWSAQRALQALHQRLVGCEAAPPSPTPSPSTSAPPTPTPSDEEALTSAWIRFRDEHQRLEYYSMKSAIEGIYWKLHGIPVPSPAAPGFFEPTPGNDILPEGMTLSEKAPLPEREDHIIETANAELAPVDKSEVVAASEVPQLNDQEQEQEPKEKEDCRKCTLCHLTTTQLEEELASQKFAVCDADMELLGPFASSVAHRICAIWCPKVYESSDGGLRGVDEEITRSRALTCRVCRQKGAAIGCLGGRCRRTYHFPCLFKDNCSLELQHYSVWCPRDASSAPYRSPPGTKGRPLRKRHRPASRADGRVQTRFRASLYESEASMADLVDADRRRVDIEALWAGVRARAKTRPQPRRPKRARNTAAPGRRRTEPLPASPPTKPSGSDESMFQRLPTAPSCPEPVDISSSWFTNARPSDRRVDGTGSAVPSAAVDHSQLLSAKSPAAAARHPSVLQPDSGGRLRSKPHDERRQSKPLRLPVPPSGL